MNVRHIGIVALLVVLTGSASFAADAKAPYHSMPVPGHTVRLDGTLGGAKTAWAYVDRHWLDKYLEVTIDAAGYDRQYGDAAVQNQLSAVADHVTVVPNGTKASVETVEPFSYGGRQDVVVRVMIEDGPMRGRELWTTCAELVDSAGHPYLRM
jgi:hypothetical protein